MIFQYFYLCNMVFRFYRRLLPLLMLSLSLLSCTPAGNVSDIDNAAADPEALVARARKELESRQFEAAMENALAALETARRTGDARGEVSALSCIVGIDIMTSRDADAWEKALEAEAIAKENGMDREFAAILVSKAKLCSYAEISPTTGRNDEGLGYAQEAISLAERAGAPEELAEAYFVAGSLYINKNRWNDPIDMALYRKAGEYLDLGEAVADSCAIPRLRRNGVLFRSRWFQQGGRNEDAIRHFERSLEALDGSDHLTAAALEDRLVNLYTRVGDNAKALAAHDAYVLNMEEYQRQKSEEALQEMETRFDLSEKEHELELRRYQIFLLLLAVLLLVAIVFLTVIRIRKVRRRNAELQHMSESKDLIIDLLSKDLKNPANAIASGLSELSASAASLSADEIRLRCSELTGEARAINSDVADYVGDILIERSRRIADLGLSSREIEIIRLSAEGLTAASIAERLYLSVHTVNTHRYHIYAKMGVKNVSEMLRKARELGIV